MSNFSDTGAKYSFQATAIGAFKDMRPGLKVVDYIRVAGAGTIELQPKLPAEGHPTETFVVEAGHYIGGQWLAIIAASAQCFPIDVQGW